MSKAGDRPFKVWDGQVRGRAELLDQDGPFDPHRAIVVNRLVFTPVGTDGIMFSGELHGEWAVGFKDRVGTRANELWRRAIADHRECPDIEVPPYRTLLAFGVGGTDPPRPRRRSGSHDGAGGRFRDRVQRKRPRCHHRHRRRSEDADRTVGAPAVRCPPHRHDHQHHGGLVTDGSHRPIRDPSPTPRPQHPRRRLRLPRL